MTTFILTIVISALAGGACGYLLARHIWQDRLIEMEEKRQELRRKRLELHRERFQESTSRIHRPTTTEAPQSGVISEELEQLRLEMILLREDHRVEKEVLRREIQQLKSDDHPLSDVEETEAVIIEAEDEVAEVIDIDEASHEVEQLEVDETDEEEMQPEIAEDEYAPLSIRSSEEADAPVKATDDVIADTPNEEDIDAVFGSTHVEGPSTDEATGDASSEMVTPEAPIVEPAAETFEESSEKVEEVEQAEKPTPKQKEDTSRSPLIAPVPTDIESLFKAPRVEEPEVAPEKKAEKAAKQEDASVAEEPVEAEPPVVEEPVEAVEAVPELGAEEPAEQVEAPVADEPVIAAEAPAEDEPAVAAEAPTEDEPAAAEEDEAQPFAIHWNADRPGRRKDLAHPAANQPDDSLDMEDHSSEPAIPVFRSLHDMLVASGVSLADTSDHEDVQANEPTWSPKSASQGSAPGSAATDKALIRSIVSLDAESFSLLDELGYASLTRLAQLSPSEIRRLAQVFRINPEQIEQDWKPTATAHLNMKSSG